MNRHFRRGRIMDGVSYAYLTILAVIATFPLVWIILSSLKSNGELTSNPTGFWPKQFSLESFRTVFGQLHFSTNIINSLIIACSTTVIAVTIAGLGAYAVVRFC